jgi:hypothetical protein
VSRRQTIESFIGHGHKWLSANMLKRLAGISVDYSRHFAVTVRNDVIGGLIRLHSGWLVIGHV